MPLFPRRNPEDAPVSGDPAPDLALLAIQRPQTLTLELLDWLIVALEAVLDNPVVQAKGQASTRASLRDALKHVDRLYPLTLTGAK